MRLIALFFFSICLVSTAMAQDTNVHLEDGQGIVGEQIDVKSPSKKYDPRKAARRSALIPGWGQIYNGTWWKVPMLYTGLGVAIHFVKFNDGRRKFWLNRASQELAKDNPNNNFLRIYRRRADQWRKNRDLVLIAIVGIYAFQIVEATVDAHLKGFNVDENLALNIKPKIGVIANGTPYLGLGITFSIGD